MVGVASENVVDRITTLLLVVEVLVVIRVVELKGEEASVGVGVGVALVSKSRLKLSGRVVYGFVIEAGKLPITATAVLELETLSATTALALALEVIGEPPACCSPS